MLTRGSNIPIFIYFMCRDFRKNGKKKIKKLKVYQSMENNLSYHSTLDGTEKSLQAALNLLKQFYIMSGLKINVDKTSLCEEFA